jgi:hypothetical protein
MIPDTGRSSSGRVENGPISCATNTVGMENCAETRMRGFTDRQSVLVPSPYAYQRGVSLVEADMGRQIAEATTCAATSALCRISPAVRVGWTRNIRLVSPSSRATGRGAAGRQPVPSNAFSR